MILVTGSTGLLGSRLLFDLTLAGKKVKALKRSSSRSACVDHYFSGKEELKKNIEWIEGDVNDIVSLEAAFQNVEQVYHCAGKVSFHSSDKDLMDRINIEGTANVVNFCLSGKIKKLCHVSSIAALGRTGTENIIDETAVWKSSKENSHYAISKYGAEREVWRGIAEGLSAVIVNPGVIIGPGNWKTDSSMLFRQVWKGLKFYTEGVNGFIDVADVSRVMIQLMDSEIENERFILVSDNIPFRNVFDHIAEHLEKQKPGVYAGPLLTGFAWRFELMKSIFTGSKPVITKESARSAKRINYYSNKKIREKLGYQFRDIFESIKDTAEVFKKSVK